MGTASAAGIEDQKGSREWVDVNQGPGPFIDTNNYRSGKEFSNQIMQDILELGHTCHLEDLLRYLCSKVAEDPNAKPEATWTSLLEILNALRDDPQIRQLSTE